MCETTAEEWLLEEAEECIREWEEHRGKSIKVRCGVEVVGM